MPKATESYRVFFALWPEAELAAQIDKVTATALRDCHGRKIRSMNLHITLAFMGSTDAEGLRCLQATAARVNAAPFEFTLDQLGYWPRPRIVWLAPTELPAPLVRLQASLVEFLAQDCAYQPETRPYRPHLSLMRKARQGPEASGIAPITWQVKQFSLIRSHTRPEGVEYEVLNDWPLRD